MANIIQGGTYIIKATLPLGLELDNTIDVYLSFGKGNKELFTIKDPIIEGNKIKVKLTQEQSLSLPIGDVLVQLNWTFMENDKKKRNCTDLAFEKVKVNLYDKPM